MNKRVKIIAILIIVTFVVVILISYIITGNSNLVNENKDIIQSDTVNNIVENDNAKVYEDDYTNININSQLAKEIFDFVPKYLQSNPNKMSEEYIVYSAICNLEEEQVVATKYIISGGEFPCYKSEIVEAAARKIFGTSVEIVKKDKYDLPIGYSSEYDVFCKYPMGFGSSEEFQVIKELKENDKTYKLTIYALNVEYDIDDVDHVYLLTKDTFKLFAINEANQDIIRQSMKEYVLNGIELDATPIANEYKNELPLIEYELEKLDDRGEKYFIKNIKLITD